MSEHHAKRISAKHQRRHRAHLRVRRRVAGTPERPRLSVFKSRRYVYAQVIDDSTGRTLAQANSMEAEMRSAIEGSPASRAAARAVGAAVAERAKKAGIETVVFDRGGYVYHGRVKALADAAREQGLIF
ncbi:MAG: 50S ribosomal protein L18 [Acidobacteria bacterium]|nr:MAG: 50S ribosomal protein L18 [Acidobacteriota bacterium]